MQVHFIKFLNIFKKKKSHISQHGHVFFAYVLIRSSVPMPDTGWCLTDLPCTICARVFVCLTLVRHAINEPIRVVIVLVIFTSSVKSILGHLKFTSWQTQLLKHFTADRLAMIIYLSPYLPRHNLRQSSPGLPSYQQSAFTWGGK